MTQRVFITGISGFLASHIALKLLKNGSKVTGSVRSMAKAEHIRKVLQTHGADTARLSFVELDLLQDDGWEEAIANHDYLIHTASPFVTTMPDDPQTLIKPAVEGTERALQAGMNANVTRIVLTSSTVAIAHGHGKHHNKTLTEADWTNVEGDDVTAYVLSKTLAEKKAWELVETAGRKDILTVINPGFIMGPVLEKDIGTSGALIHKMMSGGFPASPDIYFSCIDVRDAAELHINAMANKDIAGRRCLAAGPTIPLLDIANSLARKFPDYAKKLPTRRMPDLLVRLGALFDSEIKTASKLLGRKHQVDASCAKALLGRDFISTETAACDMAESIIDLGLP